MENGKAMIIHLLVKNNVVKKQVVKKSEFDELVRKLNAIQSNDSSNLGNKRWLWHRNWRTPNHDKYITTNYFQVHIAKRSKLAK